jgi:hypothetical protein
MGRIFLLSPARCDGNRARSLLRPAARLELARRLRAPGGAPLGEVFAFMSGLYFRGKLAYARAFAAPPMPAHDLGDGVLVITSGAGLQPASRPVTRGDLRRFARVRIAPDNPRYHRPLAESARALALRVGEDCEVVLLGSIASDKYVDVLRQSFGRLLFPRAFVGRGDLSRGGLLLRSVAAGEELEYVRVGDHACRGPRPPRLPPLRATRP